MKKMWNTPIEAYQGLLQAYCERRSVSETLACVTDDIQWIGTAQNAYANGKEMLTQFLIQDIQEMPQPMVVQHDTPRAILLSETLAQVISSGWRMAFSNLKTGAFLRATALCIKRPDGWRIKSFHVSAPGADAEKHTLSHQLQDAAQKENLLLNHIPGGVAIYYVTNVSEKVTTEYVSDGLAKMMGYTAEELLELLHDDARGNLVPEDVPKVMQAVMDGVHNNAPIEVVYRIYDSRKEPMTIRLNATVIQSKEMSGGQGATLYAIHTILPEAAKQRIEQQNEQLQMALKNAQKASEAKTTFLATVSHDMRTPLNGILGLTQLMRNRVQDESLRVDLLQLENSGRYLLNLINDLLDIGKIETNKMELHPVVCDGKSVLTSILNLIKPNLMQKNVQFYTHIAPLPYTQLYIDIGRVEQVIVNIIGNAIKFTPSGGRVDFYMENLSVIDGVIQDKMTVKDNGIGISSEFLPHLFEPFSQEHQNSRTRNNGTGLGLSISKKVIEMMGGHISVESEVGVGTTVTFTLCFPIATQEQIAASAGKKVQNQEDFSVLAGKRILLCEDHALNAQIATRMLQNYGAYVIWAKNGKEGVQAFLQSPDGYFDAILMDIRMPEMDGLTAARQIRAAQHPQAKTIPMIAMTANAFAEDIAQSHAAGMNAHLSKPIEPQALFHTLVGQIQHNRIK